MHVLFTFNCVSLVDMMSEQQLNTEYTRFKDIVSVLPTNTPSKTPCKTITRSEKKREVLKSALLQIISKDCIGMKAQYDEIQSMMKDIKEANSAAPTKLIVKDVETSTDDIDIKNVSTAVTGLRESKDASTFVEDIASTSSSTEIRTRRSQASSNLSECPTSSSTRQPPIGLPGTLLNPKKDILLGKSSCRTLFLTDSILSHINVNSFKTNQNETCVKKTMYYVTDFSNFEPEFGYATKLLFR